jgi:hypothetical protein
MGACPVESRDDVGDRIANAWNFAKPALRYNAVKRLGEGRQALGGA